MITPILIISALTVLPFGFDSASHHESNRFQHWLGQIGWTSDRCRTTGFGLFTPNRSEEFRRRRLY